MTSSQQRLALLCAAVYLLLSSFLVLHVVKDTGGHFIYPLDDPYIHLALAENLAHGHYGINATEFSVHDRQRPNRTVLIRSDQNQGMEKAWK
jgi:hypothetical protein